MLEGCRRVEEVEPAGQVKLLGSDQLLDTGIRVWTVPDSLVPPNPEVQAAGARGVEGEERDEREKPAPRLKPPLAFQRLGPEVWADPEPQSHRAQHPWLLAHVRETLESVREIIETVVDPQVERLRSFRLAAEDTLDMRTEYDSTLRTEAGELQLVTVRREDGPPHLAAVRVRRTRRARGDMAGRGGDQERCEELSRPILVIGQPCGCLLAVSVDFKLGGLDTKMIRMLNQRTGSYCYCCRASEADAHSVEVVREGFAADLSMEELTSLARELMEVQGVAEADRQEHVFPNERGDYPTRLGIKRFPLSTILDSTRPFAVLHTALLRLYGWVETLIIR